MTFTYKETTSGNDSAELITENGTTVTFLYSDKDYATEIQLDGVEFDGLTDTLRGIFVLVGSEFISVYDLAIKADRWMKDVRKEISRDVADYAEHIRTMSSAARYL